jgi:hypothetical protein
MKWEEPYGFLSLTVPQIPHNALRRAFEVDNGYRVDMDGKMQPLFLDLINTLFQLVSLFSSMENYLEVSCSRLTMVNV